MGFFLKEKKKKERRSKETGMNEPASSFPRHYFVDVGMSLQKHLDSSLKPDRCHLVVIFIPPDMPHRLTWILLKMLQSGQCQV